MPSPQSEAAAGYMRFRRATDRYVEAYARNLAFRPAQIRTTYDLFTRDGAVAAALTHQRGRRRSL